MSRFRFNGSARCAISARPVPDPPRQPASIRRAPRRGAQGLSGSQPPCAQDEPLRPRARSRSRQWRMFNSFGHLFRVTTWGESHGPALGCVVDGCPPGIALTEADIQPWLDARRPGQSRFTTQRQEADQVEILSGTFEGRTTGTPISLMIRNTDQRSKDYSEIAAKFRPGHADLTYHLKYGLRDYRGGGRSSRARDRGPGRRRRRRARGAGGAAAGRCASAARWCRWASARIDRAAWDWDEVPRNPFWCPDAGRRRRLGRLSRRPAQVRQLGRRGGRARRRRRAGRARRAGLRQARQRPRRALMTINAVKGVEIGAGFAAAALTGVGERRRDLHGQRRARASRRTTPAASSAASRRGRTSSPASR